MPRTEASLATTRQKKIQTSCVAPAGQLHSQLSPSLSHLVLDGKHHAVREAFEGLLGVQLSQGAQEEFDQAEVVALNLDLLAERAGRDQAVVERESEAPELCEEGEQGTGGAGGLSCGIMKAVRVCVLGWAPFRREGGSCWAWPSSTLCLMKGF